MKSVTSFFSQENLFRKQSIVSDQDLISGNELHDQACAQQEDSEQQLMCLIQAAYQYNSYFAIKDLIKKFYLYIGEGEHKLDLQKLIVLFTHCLKKQIIQTDDASVLLDYAKTLIEELTQLAINHGTPGFCLAAYAQPYLAEFCLTLNKNFSQQLNQMLYTNTIHDAYKKCSVLLYAAQLTVPASEAEIINTCGKGTEEYNLFHNYNEFSKLIDGYHKLFYLNFVGNKAAPKTVFIKDAEETAKLYLNKNSNSYHI